MSDSAEFLALKQRMKSTWMAGDFGQIARIAERSAEEFVDRLDLQPGMRVLDVACGTGNQSVPAARTGADVTGLDIAPNLLEQARERARQENLSLNLIEGDAEQLPHKEAEFDVVLSMFGAMFAPRPERVVSEFLRVCRPGGMIAMGNWTPGGFVGKSFALNGRYVPLPPGVPAPALWGNERVVAERFGDKAQLQMTPRMVKFDVPCGPEEVVELFKTYFGPTKTAFERLDANGQRAMQNDLVRLWADHNEGRDGHTVVQAEYLEVHARPN
ncbi:MAG: class I SAM-dependent methyltransferase [Acidobacteriales bacterium]|nr:class I SAM-dependent methyltransferase [Terriglobales bacterium]